MAKKQPAEQKPKPKLKQFACINPTLQNHSRIWFVDQKGATEHATDIFQRKRRFHNYEPPPKLLIVKVVGVVEISTRKRKPRLADTECT